MEKNPDLPFVPASTLKVVTTAAALHRLQPDYQFLTEVLADNIRGSSVGNLFLKGYGDPHLVSEETLPFDSLVERTGAQGDSWQHSC